MKMQPASEAPKLPRPQYVAVTFFDPWDERILTRMKIIYDRRLAADGFYSKHIKQIVQGLRLKVFSDVLQGRTPATRTTLIY
jgi:hypothetical protein